MEVSEDVWSNFHILKDETFQGQSLVNVHQPGGHAKCRFIMLYMIKDGQQIKEMIQPKSGYLTGKHNPEKVMIY